MKILLDECVPVQVKQALPLHEIHASTKLGWAGISNGELLAAAEQAEFELLILADKNLRYQQNLSGRRIAILELWTNHRPTLEQHFAHIRAAAETMQPGEYRVLESPNA